MRLRALRLHNVKRFAGRGIAIENIGDGVNVLTAANEFGKSTSFEALHAHEETGNAHTYARDLAVGRWCRDHGVGWHEVPQFGVVRRLKSRNTWQARWEAHMAPPTLAQPALHFFKGLPPLSLTPQTLAAPSGLQHNPPQRQPRRLVRRTPMTWRSPILLPAAILPTQQLHRLPSKTQI